MKTCKSYEMAGKGLNKHTTGLDGTLDLLLRRHQGHARRFAYSLSGNLDEADELVQQAGCKALRHWNSYDPMRSFESWYLTIVKNLFKDALKQALSGRLVSLDAPLDHEGDMTFADSLPHREAGLFKQLESREAVKAVRRSLLELKKSCRTVLTLCDIEGMPYDEAARKLGLPPGTVRSRLSRARAALRRKIELAQII